MKADSINCKQCNGTMQRHKKTEKNMAVQVLGVLVFLLGIVFLAFTPIGTIIGILLMMSALFMGYKKIKGWKCQNCGYFFEAE